MTFPPSPDPFGTQPPAGGGQPGMPPQWGPQQQWAANPQPGPGRGGGKTKWILGGLVVALAIALAVVITVVLVRPDNNSDDTANDGATDVATSEFASANDTGPITIITEDPSCAAWLPVIKTLSGSSKGWAERDSSIPGSEWSHEQRAQYEQVGQALRAAADQTEPLVKLTSHRVMRQLYEQFIAYARAFSDRIPTYTPSDNALDLTASAIGRVLSNICSAISFGSAAARAALVPAGDAPNQLTPEGDPSNTQRFLHGPNPLCQEWATTADQFLSDIDAWRHTDSNIPASQWSPEQKTLSEEIAPVMRSSADALEALGRRSENPIWQDFAEFAAQYRRAYAQALPTYAQADVYLYYVALYTSGVIRGACDAAEV